MSDVRTHRIIVSATKKFKRQPILKSLKARHMERYDLDVDAFDDPTSLRVREFCDPGLKRLGEHQLFEPLVRFLDPHTALELYFAGKSFHMLAKGAFYSAFFHLAMAQFVKVLPPAFMENAREQNAVMQFAPIVLTHSGFLWLMFGLIEILHTGWTQLMRYRRRSISMLECGCTLDQLTCGLPPPLITLRSTWHATWPEVGILWVTREQYERALHWLLIRMPDFEEGEPLDFDATTIEPREGQPLDFDEQQLSFFLDMS
jgi:hypothetical protein